MRTANSRTHTNSRLMPKHRHLQPARGLPSMQAQLMQATAILLSKQDIQASHPQQRPSSISAAINHRHLPVLLPLIDLP